VTAGGLVQGGVIEALIKLELRAHTAQHSATHKQAHAAHTPRITGASSDGGWHTHRRMLAATPTSRGTSTPAAHCCSCCCALDTHNTHTTHYFLHNTTHNTTQHNHTHTHTCCTPSVSPSRSPYPAPCRPRRCVRQLCAVTRCRRCCTRLARCHPPACTSTCQQSLPRDGCRRPSTQGEASRTHTHPLRCPSHLAEVGEVQVVVLAGTGEVLKRRASARCQRGRAAQPKRLRRKAVHGWLSAGGCPDEGVTAVELDGAAVSGGWCCCTPQRRPPGGTAA
jgi:hypothetical protein